MSIHGMLSICLILPFLTECTFLYIANEAYKPIFWSLKYIGTACPRTISEIHSGEETLSFILYFIWPFGNKWIKNRNGALKNKMLIKFLWCMSYSRRQLKDNINNKLLAQIPIYYLKLCKFKTLLLIAVGFLIL